jgi:hypothetical protein
VNLVRHVVVFDAADVGAESAFWAALLGGVVVDDDPGFHCVVDSDSRWLLGVQHDPDHTPPGWPDDEPHQQLHLDLHVDDPVEACANAVELGARPLFTEHDPNSRAEGFRVFADPAGHPFCIGWGHPDDATIRQHVANLRAAGTAEHA